MIDYNPNIDFERIYINNFARFKRFAKEYVLSEQEAENIVQDVFLSLWERRDRINGGINLQAYLFTSIKNKCVDYLRRQLTNKELKHSMEAELRRTLSLNYESLEEISDDIFSENTIEELISKSLEKLPERCRQIFIKSRIEGKKQSEIAQELNISLNTVESQMGIAYRKLRQELKNILPLLCFLLCS